MDGKLINRIQISDAGVDKEPNISKRKKTKKEEQSKKSLDMLELQKGNKVMKLGTPKE